MWDLDRKQPESRTQPQTNALRVKRLHLCEGAMASLDVLTIEGAKLWEDAIKKERVARRPLSIDRFSVRNAVTVQQVPTKFKPGHLLPQQLAKDGARGFLPADFGLDPNGVEAKEIHRVIREQSAGPRARTLLPQTCFQDVGWAVTIPESRVALEKELRRKRVDRVHRKRAQKSAELGPARAQDSGQGEGTERPKSELLWPPPPPGAQGREKAAAPESQLSAAAHTSLSMASSTGDIPSALSINPSQLTHVTSLPGAPPDMARQVKALDIRQAGIINELRKYGPGGEFGGRWSRPLKSTDATSFDDAFIKATSLPPYKLFR